MNPPEPTIVVIGAGAAGMMAAATAAQRGARVIVLEKNNKTGVKILMSGGTRCNLTQDTDAKGITAAFGKSGRFLQPSVGRFTPAQVVEHFENLGIATKREATGKIFPQSDRAVEVRDALLSDMLDAGVDLRLRATTHSIVRDDTFWKVSYRDQLNDQHEIRASAVIVTAGGKSWPGCGTTGDAYAWLRDLGHEIVPPRPALVPLVGGTEQTHAISGLTLPDVVASVQAIGKKKPLVQRRASWLFTHFGFSGPAAMDVSGTITAASSFDSVSLTLDILPDTTTEQVMACLSSSRGKRSVVNTLADWIPTRLAEMIARSSGAIRDDGEVISTAELPKRVATSIAAHLKTWKLPVRQTRGFAKAEVTAGGVSLKQIDPQTMHSRLCPGLFIAGEVLDVDGWIGGYNFQAAFSTGRAAGIAANTWMNDQRAK